MEAEGALLDQQLPLVDPLATPLAPAVSVAPLGTVLAAGPVALGGPTHRLPLGTPCAGVVALTKGRRRSRRG